MHYRGAMRAAALLSVILCVAPSAARAQDTDVPRAQPELAYSWSVDGAIVLGVGSAWVGSELFKSAFAPERCRWCATNSLDTRVSESLAWKNIHTASTVGDVTGFVVTPLVTLGALSLAASSEDRLNEMPVNALLVVESVVVAAAVNQLVKFSVGRERPFVADLPEELKGSTDQPSDNNLSFYSGHSNLVFALAVSSGTLAHLRGYKAEPYVWAVGLPVAAFVADSRVAAKKHYLPAVLVGRLAGAGFGCAIPTLFHSPRSTNAQQLTLAPAPGGISIAGRF